MTALAVILVAAGVFFVTVSGIGLVRLPDFYSRAHAVGKTETLGIILILSGLAVYSGWALSTIKLVFIVLFLLLASPAATHAIMRSAFISNLQPWARKDRQNAKTMASDEPVQKESRG